VARDIFYPNLVDPETGSRRPTYKTRQQFLDSIKIVLEGSDVVVEGMVLEAIAAAVWGDWRQWWVLANVSAEVRHPAEWDFNALLTIPDLTTAVIPVADDKTELE
jgi:hypothetical protein